MLKCDSLLVYCYHVGIGNSPRINTKDANCDISRIFFAVFEYLEIYNFQIVHYATTITSPLKIIM